MNVEQQKQYQLENLGILRKDEVSQGQCLFSHLDLATAESRYSPWVASAEVAAWNAFEANDPNPDGDCEGLDRIGGGNLHRVRILSDVKNQTLSRRVERKHKHRSKQENSGESSRENNPRDNKKTSARLKSTPLSSSSNAQRIVVTPPVDWISSTQVPFVPQTNGQNSSYPDAPFKETSRSRVFGSQISQRLSDPCDFMAAVSKASYIVPKDPIIIDNSNIGTSWSAIQDLIDLNFGNADQPCSSGFNSSAWPQEATQFCSATEIPISSAIIDTSNADQSSSSISSIKKQQKPVNLTNDNSSRRYDAHFLKKFSNIRTLFKPFHSDAAPIIRNQARLCLPSMPIEPLSNLSLEVRDSEQEYLIPECFGGLQAPAIINGKFGNDFDRGKYASVSLI